mmetsp:Transcript_60567/g.138446  ORF Transcript_60567/g.138446 Transcript_60567/m.138446 type:complete len:243 (-) Transcript_60567:8-736(-)
MRSSTEEHPIASMPVRKSSFLISPNCADFIFQLITKRKKVCCGVPDFSSDPPARSSPNRRKPPISIFGVSVSAQYFSQRSLIAFLFRSACDCTLLGVFFCGEPWLGGRCTVPELLRCPFAATGARTPLSLPIRMSFVPETPTAQAPHHSLRSTTFIRLSFDSSGISERLFIVPVRRQQVLPPPLFVRQKAPPLGRLSSPWRDSPLRRKFASSKPTCRISPVATLSNETLTPLGKAQHTTSSP